jgi:ATP-dependent exoDNAse (exonuclease V) beta subunit
MNLTPAQHAAAFDRAAENVVLTSGAGCGKTAVLARRFTQLLITHPDRKNPLAHFVALTFTDKAAMEMRDRVGSMLRELASQAAGEDRVRIRQWLDYLPEARIMTIHSFCRQLLRTYAVDIGLDPAFTVLADELVVAELLHQAIHETLVAHLDAGQEDTAGLMTELGFDQLAEGMKWLIEQRTAVGLDDIPSSADLLSHWHDCQQALGDAKWQELIDGGIVEQLEDILAIPCHNEADKLNRFRAEKIALARTLIQSPADRTAAALQEVAKSPGGIGSAKAWGDKDTVKAVRQTLKDTLGPLGEMALYAMDMGPADEGAARALSHLMALAADANTRFTHAKAMRGGLDFTDLLR